MGYTTTIRRMLRRLGLDLHRAQPQVQDFLAFYGIDCVVDVGANVGQFAASLREYGYRHHILSIEPAGSVFQQLQRNAARDAEWQCLQCGLAAQDGELTLRVSEESTFSSMREPLKRALDFDVRARTVHEEIVPVTTLDSIVETHCQKFNKLFLKLDVQGFESEVLAGATQSLRRFQGIQVELSIQKLYSEQSTMHEMIQRLDEQGFVLALCSPVNFQEDGAPRLLELDGVFLNTKLQ